MKDYSYIVKTVIQNLIASADENHYFLNTQVIKERLSNHIDTKCDTDIKTAFCRIGLANTIERWLYNFGYYSIGKGRFVNLEKCYDERSLDLVIQNAERDVDIKKKAYKRKRELANGQSRLNIVGNEINGLVFAMTQEEYDSFVDNHTIGYQMEA